MKCPHCNTAIAAAFTESGLVQYPEVRSRTGQSLAGQLLWLLSHQRCPECHETIIYLRRLSAPPNANPQSHNTWPVDKNFMAYPRSATRPIPAEVPSPYRDDFAEACKVLADSPKASAALSRRCLQAILRDQAATKARDLADQIEEVTHSGKVPSHIQEGLHAVRNIGNFAAHTIRARPRA